MKKWKLSLKRALTVKIEKPNRDCKEKQDQETKDECPRR